MENEYRIYRLNDDISFRLCTLCHGRGLSHGDCTNFYDKEENWKTYYYCHQDGIHLHCTKHPAIELEVEGRYGETYLKCPKCGKQIEIDSLHNVIFKCLRLLNIEKFKDAKLIRLDDWYTPEVKEKVKINSDYWVEADVKTDKDGDTIVVLYIGHSGAKEKAQFFIKPEKCQLASDHKDMDPAKVLSKIEVTLKNRLLSQQYGE